jgi:Family of unknown function (DUF5995)
MERSADVDGLIARMEALLLRLREQGDANRHFLATYLRTTRAVRDELATGGFLDRAWVERWDVAFAELYLDALEAERAGRRLAELERLAAARVADLVAPGQVVLKLAVRGFGVRLPENAG